MSLIFKKSSAQPEFTVGAAITGTAQVGQTLTCTYTVTKARPANVTVRWYSYFDNVGTDQVLLGTGTTYVLTGNEFNRFIRAIVTATNPAGTVQSTSSYTAAVTVAAPPDPPTIVTAAAITGTLEIGQTATVTYDFDGETSVAIQWFKYTSAGGGGATALGTETEQSLSALQDGNYIGCEVTATNAAGSTKSTAPILGPVVSAASDVPTIVSAASVQLDDGAVGFNEGEYLICDFECSGHTTTPTFAWYKCDAGRANPVELTGAGEALIRPLFKSEPNKYRGAIFLDQSLGLNAAGKYIYCVATATNGFGSNTSTSNLVGPIGAIQGTPISQTTVGSGEDPYLIQASGTYYLAENIEFKQTGFALLADNITLNLNGKTVTWGNEAIVGPTNPSFESGESGWDWTGSGNTAAGAGDAGGNEYLYILATVATSTETAEQRAYNQGRAHAGANSLAWTAAAAGDNGVFHYVESAEFTCTAGKWYSVSFRHHAYSRSTTPIPKIEVRKDGVTVATWSLTSGQSYNLLAKGPTSGELMFKAAESSPTYTIRVGVQGVTGKTSAGWFDDFRISRGRSAGVLYGQEGGTSTSGWVFWYTAYASNPNLPTGTAVNTTALRDRYNFAPPPDVTVGATVSGCLVKNGVLTQGAGQCFSGHALKNGYAARRISSSVNGPNASQIGPRTDGVGVLVTDCNFTTSHNTCGHRDAYYGAALWKVHGTVARTTLTEQVASGIACLSGNLTVYGCTIKGRVRATNSFGIIMRGAGYTADIHDNVIDHTGDYYGRGLILDAGFGGSVYNNSIAIRQSEWNSDTVSGYSPYVDDGDYAIQIEGPGAAIIRVYANDITAVSQGSTLNHPPRTQAVRPKGMYSTANVEIYNNNITVTASGAGTAHAYGAKTVYGPLKIYDNVVNTNSGYIYANDATGLVIDGDTINYEATTVRGYPAVVPYTAARPSFGADFLDCTLDAEALAVIGSDAPRNDSYAYIGTWVVGQVNYRVAWTITVETGSAGASVTITDQHATVVASGTANAQGVFIATIPQTTHTVPSNATKLITTHSPYTAAATLDALSGSTQFTADAAKTVVVSMS